MVKVVKVKSDVKQMELPQIQDFPPKEFVIPDTPSLILPYGMDSPSKHAATVNLGEGQNILFVGVKDDDNQRFAAGILGEVAKRNNVVVASLTDGGAQKISDSVDRFKADIVFLPHPDDKSQDAVKLRDAVFEAATKKTKIAFYPKPSVEGINLTFSFSDPTQLFEGYRMNESQMRVRFDESIVDAGRLNSLLFGGEKVTGGEYIHSFEAEIIESGVRKKMVGTTHLTKDNYQDFLEKKLGRRLGDKSWFVMVSPHADDGLLYAGNLGRQMVVDGFNAIDIVVVSGHRGVNKNFLGELPKDISEEDIVKQKVMLRAKEIASSSEVMGWGNHAFLNAPLYETKDPATQYDVKLLDDEIRRISEKGDIVVFVVPPLDDSHRDHVRTAQMMESLFHRYSEKPVLVLRGRGPWAKPELNTYFMSDEKPKLSGGDLEIYNLGTFRTPVVSEIIDKREPGNNIDEKRMWRTNGKRPVTEGFYITDLDTAKQMHMESKK